MGGGASPGNGRGGTLEVPLGGRKRGRPWASGQGGSCPRALGSMVPRPAAVRSREGDAPSLAFAWVRCALER